MNKKFGCISAALESPQFRSLRPILYLDAPDNDMETIFCGKLKLRSEEY